MKTALKNLFVFLAVPALVVGSYLWFSQEALIFPAPNGPAPVSEHDGFDLVSIQTSDGETLPALFHSPLAGETTIIRFHGNGDFLESQRRVGHRLAEAGFGVLLVEYRGYPGATGSPSQKGLYLDGQAAFDKVRSLSKGKITLFAHSLGTAVAVKVASENAVSALVLESPFESLSGVVKARFPILPVDWLLRHPFPSDQFIQNIKAPVLILHGNRDTIVPISHGRKLARSGNDISFVEIIGAGHELTGFGSIERAIRFFRKHK